jgi:translation initiation factor IF-2
VAWRVLGIPDLLMLLIQLTQSMMNERLSYIADLECVVLEVKMVEGHGMTIDVILVNGALNEGDTIVVWSAHSNTQPHCTTHSQLIHVDD